MKAEFKKTKAADGLPLTFGKMYDVLDVKAGRKPWQLKEIKVKNDLGQERWYKASKFKLFAEAAAYLREPTAAGAGQGAAQSATPDGSQMIREADAAAGYTAREMLKVGEAIVAGLQDGIGLHYGA
ncbi:MAG: hypothetical protein NC548_22305 [Lachnospiraceae bacterium]|nr:hypothetical protein [Lachnospiraceae bacterium]